MILIQDINISMIDSRDDSKITFLNISGTPDFLCRVPISKAKLNDLCYIMKLVGNTCHIELDTKGCEEARWIRRNNCSNDT